MNNNSAIGNGTPLLPDPIPYGFRDFVTHTIAGTAPASAVTNAVTSSQKCERGRVDLLKKNRKALFKNEKAPQKETLVVKPQLGVLPHCFARGVKVVTTSP